MADTQTLTRARLADAIQREIGLSHRQCARLVDQIIGHMADALEKGEHVKIARFGTFYIRTTPFRLGRNPKTGELHPIISLRTVRLRPYEALELTPQPRQS